MKYAYADELAILYPSGEWKELERTLSQDMTIGYSLCLPLDLENKTQPC